VIPFYVVNLDTGQAVMDERDGEQRLRRFYEAEMALGWIAEHGGPAPRFQIVQAWGELARHFPDDGAFWLVPYLEGRSGRCAQGVPVGLGFVPGQSGVVYGRSVIR
jgi:hypothetical protein